MINEFSVVAKLSDSKMNNSCWQVYPSRKWKCLGKVPLIMIPTRNTTNEKVNTVCNIQGNLKKTLEQQNITTNVVVDFDSNQPFCLSF